MKRVLLLIFPILFAACSKDDSNNSSVPQTKFTITAVDQFGNKVNQANVKLYLSSDNWRNDINPSNQNLTGNDGVVVFDNLTSAEYHYRITKGCLSNNLGNVRTTLISGVNNLITEVIEETGNLVLKNNSSNKYGVYLNGVPLITMNGKSTSTFNNNIHVGNNKVRVLQLEGYILFPTDLTFDVTTFCNGTNTVSFP